MRPVRIFIDRIEESFLRINEIKYTFQTLLNIVGLPCHFIQAKEDDSGDIYYGKYCSGGYKLFIKMADIKKESIRTPIKAVTENDFVFLLFDGGQGEGKIVVQNGSNVSIRNDIILSSFYLLSGWQEKFIRRDRKDRHFVRESFLYQERLIHNPIINHYATIFRDLFADSHHPVTLWPSNKKYAVALSHDVDYPEMIRWIEVLRYLGKYKMGSKLTKITDILMGKESFWRFEDWIQLEKSYGFRSAIYFCGLKGNLFRYLFKAPDPFYDVREDKFKKVLKLLIQDGFEVGLHSSYFAYQSIDRFKDEKNKVEEALGQSVWGNRHHYMHMNPDNPSETALMHHEIGLLYDTSMCFLQRAGFRLGICSPFHLYDPISQQTVPTLQLPTSLMDDHLFGRMKFSYFDHLQFEIEGLLHSIKKYGGVFVVDYHIRVFNSTFFPKWADSYEYILKRITETDDFYSDTPLNIAKYWEEREVKLLKESKDETCGLN